MNLQEIIKIAPNTQFVVTGAELKEFGLSLMNEQAKSTETETKERLMTQEEVAKHFGVTRNTLWRWEKQNYLVPLHVGRKVYYKSFDVERLTDKKA